MVVQVLNGAKPGDMAVQGVEKMELFVNPAAAQKMGVTLDPTLLDEAKEIVK